MEKDLKWIKKHYGEKMMHLCRELFPTILETDGLLTSILESHFPHCRHLADDIVRDGQVGEFTGYIISQVPTDENEKEEEKKKPEKSAVELMKEAGYILYPECMTERDIQSFKKYYEKKEELCTFNGDRLNSCRVWFAVKDNVDEIKRENFQNPQRQDEYGTSVISIQFSKTRRSLSIKNRYNHMVDNPDNTFNNCLDNIISGLTDAFEADYGVRDIRDKNYRLELSHYVFVDGKYYPYNFESNNVYYCENDTIIDFFNVKKLPSYQRLLDCFVIDAKNHTIEKYMPDGGKNFQHEDCFDETIGKIVNMTHEKDGIHIVCENGDKVFIGFDEKGRITAYENANLTEIGDMFLADNMQLNRLYLPNLKECGSNFLYINRELQELDLPNLEKCGRNFLDCNRKIRSLNLPKLRECGYGFMQVNTDLESISLPSLEKCGSSFMDINEKWEHLDFPKLRECGNDFCSNVRSVKTVNLPNLEICGSGFLTSTKMERVSLPNLTKCGDNFLAYNSLIKEVSLPNLAECGSGFLWQANQIEELSLPNLRQYDRGFMGFNRSLKRLKLPKLEKACVFEGPFSEILGVNQVLEELDVPSIFALTPEFHRLIGVVKKNNKINKNEVNAKNDMLEPVQMTQTEESKQENNDAKRTDVQRGVINYLKSVVGKCDDKNM